MMKIKNSITVKDVVSNCIDLILFHLSNCLSLDLQASAELEDGINFFIVKSVRWLYCFVSQCVLFCV